MGFCNPFHIPTGGEAHKVQGRELKFHGVVIKVYFLVFIVLG